MRIFFTYVGSNHSKWSTSITLLWRNNSDEDGFVLRPSANPPTDLHQLPSCLRQPCKNLYSTKVHLLYKPRLTPMHSCGIFTPMADTSVEKRTPLVLHKGSHEICTLFFLIQYRLCICPEAAEYLISPSAESLHHRVFPADWYIASYLRHRHCDPGLLESSFSPSTCVR